MADDKIQAQNGVVNRGNDTARRGNTTVATGKADDSGRTAAGDGSMSTAKLTPPAEAPAESLGDAARRLKTAKTAKPAAKAPVYHKGTMKVPKTGPAILKKGEMVVPAKKASAIRSQVKKVKKAKASKPNMKSMAPLMGDMDKDGM